MWTEYASIFFIFSQTKHFAKQKKFRISNRQYLKKPAYSLSLPNSLCQTVLKFLKIHARQFWIFSAFHSLLFPFAFLDLITFLSLWNLWQHMTIKSHNKQPSWWDTNLLFGMKSIISDQHCAGILGWSNSGRSRCRPDLPTSACCEWQFWNITLEQMFLDNISDDRHQRNPLRRESTVPLRWRTRTWPKQQQIPSPNSIQNPSSTFHFKTSPHYLDHRLPLFCFKCFQNWVL